MPIPLKNEIGKKFFVSHLRCNQEYINRKIYQIYAYLFDLLLLLPLQCELCQSHLNLFQTNCQQHHHSAQEIFATVELGKKKKRI